MNIYHSAYKAMLPLWQKVRDVLAGEEVVKSRTTDYLPKLASQSDSGDPYARESYANYLLRANFFGAAGRTEKGLTGAVLHKAPTMEGVPESEQQAIEDALGVNYESAETLTAAQVADLATVGRYFLLVDKGADAEAKPYVVKFRTEDLVFWATTEIMGRETLTTAIIRQSYSVPDDEDPIGVRTKDSEQWLVLRLGRPPAHYAQIDGAEGFNGAPSEPFYWKEVWRERDEGKGKGKTMGTAPTEIRVPTKNGGRFWAEIPGDIVTAGDGISAAVEIPPMLSLANCILSIYRSSADLEWGTHMVAIPQPYITGYQPEEGERLVMGCGYAWALPSEGAGVGFLEFSGSGLGRIAESIRDKKQEAAIMGARMLEDQPNAAEAMGTVRLRQSGDRSILATIAHNVSEAMTRAIQRYLSWQLPSFESIESQRAIRYSLSADFDSSRMEPAELASMTQALQEGTISWETFAHNLRRGELLPDGVTDEEELLRIRNSVLIRKPDAVAAMLQVDVREGRISKATYLAEIQKLGLLRDVDLAAEADKIYEEKVVAAEIQMLAFSQAGANFGSSAPADEPADDQEQPVDEPAPADETEQPSAITANDEQAATEPPPPTLNELTLSIERLVRAGNTDGANLLLGKVAELLGLKTLGKVPKQKVSPK